MNDKMFFVFLGFLIGFLHDVLLSLSNFFNEKAWRVHDYEKIIFRYVDEYDAEDTKEEEIIVNAHIEYKQRLKKKERLDKFLSKFRR